MTALERLAPYLFLFAEVLLFFRKILFSSGFVIPWDIRGYHLPIAWFTAESLRRFELPLWDPWVYCGRPLYANLTAQVFYPPMLATLGLFNLTGSTSSDTLLYFLEWHLVLHIFLGGCFAYLLAKEMGLTSAGSAMAGTVFQLGAFFASQSQHLGAVDAASYLPLAWLLTSRYSRQPIRAAVALSIVFALVFLAGFPAVTFVVFASTALFALLQREPKALAGVVAGIAGGLGLAAIQLLPTMELTGLSVARFRAEWMGTGGGLRPQALVSMLVPNQYGLFDLKSYRFPSDPTMMFTFCGWSAVAFALIAMAKRTGQTVGLAVLALVCALWMLGDSTVAGRLAFAALPDVAKSSIYPQFALVAFTLCVALMAGLGLALVRGRPLVQWAFVVLAAAELIAVSSGRPINTASLKEEPGISDSHFDGIPEIPATMRQLAGETSPGWRIDTVDDSIDWVLGAPLTKVATASGNDPFALERFMKVRGKFVKGERWGRYYQVEDLASPVLDFLSVRFVLSRGELPAERLAAAGFRKRAELPGRVVYENPEAQARFFFSGSIAALSAAGNGRVKLIEYSPRRVRATVDSKEPGFLMSSEAAYPGWEARVDGAPSEIATAHGAFRAVPVSAGRHDVLMEFRPPVLWRGAAVSMLAVLILAAAWLSRTRFAG